MWAQAPTSDRLHEWGHGGAPIGPCYVCGAPASDSLIHLATSCLGGKCRSIRGDTWLRLTEVLGGKEAEGILTQLGLRLQEGLRGSDGTAGDPGNGIARTKGLIGVPLWVVQPLRTGTTNSIAK